MRGIVVACLACACGRIGFDEVATAAAHRRAVAVMAGTDQTLVGFPVGVIVAADAQLAAGARADGRDLAFTDADGTTLLPFEIESYDGASGALVAWVRVPSLTSATTLYLYYGGTALDQQDPAQTWQTCLGVWHLGDVGDAHDSTAHAHTLQAGSAIVPPTVTGIAGGARAFDAGRSLAIAAPPDGSLDMGTSSYSVSMWVHITTPNGLFDMPLYKGGGDNVTPGYDFEIGSNTWRTDIGDGTTANYAMFQTIHDSWVQLVAVADRSTQMLYAYTNAAPTDMIAIGTIGSITSTLPLALGDTTHPFAGLLDELRIYDHAVTPAWITAEYDNLTDPGGFAALGPEEPAP